MKKILAAGIGAGALIALGAIAPANAADGAAQLSVLHACARPHRSTST